MTERKDTTLRYDIPRGPLAVLRAAGTLATLVAFVLLYLDLTGRITTETARFRYIVADTILCGVFAIEFGLLYWRSNNRRACLRRHWPDLLAAVPMIHEMRAFRAFRFLRVLRALRVGGLVLRASREFEDLLRIPLMRSALTVAVVALVVGSIAIRDVERDNDGLNTFDKALWWSVVTMATVGYGDACPRTGLGKVIAGTLMVIGIGLFGAVAGACASVIIRSKDETPPAARRLADLEERCARLENDAAARGK